MGLSKLVRRGKESRRCRRNIRTKITGMLLGRWGDEYSKDMFCMCKMVGQNQVPKTFEVKSAFINQGYIR